MQTSQDQQKLPHLPHGDNGSARSVHPSTGARELPPRPKMPLAGAIFGLAAIIGLAAWVGIRIKEANGARAAVVEKRTADAKRSAAEALEPQKIRITRGSVGTWQPIVEFEGTLAAAQSADLGFKVPGRIAAVKVKLGDKVKAGQVLAVLDASEASSQLKAAEAQVQAARAQLVLAEDSERRTAQLVSSGSIAEAQGVQTSQQKSLANAQLEAAQAQVGLARVSLGNHSLTAPFAGTLTRVPDGIGGVVGAGIPLFGLANLENFKLKATVGEQDANLLRIGSEVQITTEREVAKGTITAIVGALDPMTRRVPIEAVIQNTQDVSLRAGSFVRAKVVGGEAIRVVRISRDALRPGSQDEIFVVQSGVLESRRITFATDKDGSLLVRHNLSESEDVMLSPKAETRGGDKVVVEVAGGASK